MVDKASVRSRIAMAVRMCGITQSSLRVSSPLNASCDSARCIEK